MMLYKIFLIIVLTCAAGCKLINASDDSQYAKACTLAGSLSSIHVDIHSAAPLPSNFAIALNNGDEIDVDECNSQKNPFENSMEVGADRMHTTVDFRLDPTSKDYAFYFFDESLEPTSNSMRLLLYSRSTCNDVYSQFQDISNIQISWKAVYANGKNCGVTSHLGDAQMSVQ